MFDIHFGLAWKLVSRKAMARKRGELTTALPAFSDSFPGCQSRQEHADDSEYDSDDYFIGYTSVVRHLRSNWEGSTHKRRRNGDMVVIICRS